MRATAILIVPLAFAAGLFAAEPPTPRQADVREKGAQVMPFALEKTVHVFDKTGSGGVQRVRSRAGEPDQVTMIRAHLRDIAQAFSARDFGKPAHIHGADMPGLAEMQRARAGELEVAYRDLDDGAEITYTAHSPALIDAVHRWFDAQLSDHGGDATTSRSTPPLEAFIWLAGRWDLDNGPQHTEEIWTSPASDLMLGMSRTVRDGKTTSFEFMRIVSRPDGIFYVAQPHGKPPVEFPLRAWDGAEATFVNPGHEDHLSRIVYRRNADGSLTARIEGSNNGKDFSEEYPYHRGQSQHSD